MAKGDREEFERLLRSASDRRAILEAKKTWDMQRKEIKNKIWKLAWSWTVVGGALFFIWGGALTFMTSSHPLLADLFYLVGSSLFLLKFLTWEEHKNQPTATRRKWSIIGVTVTALLTFLAILGTHKLNVPVVKTEAVQTSQEKDPSPFDPKHPFLKSWGSTVLPVCSVEFDATKLLKFRADYDVALMCEFESSRVDRYKDENVSVSHNFTIEPKEDMVITIDYSKNMMRIANNAHRAKADLLASIDIILVPKAIDASRLPNLSEVTKVGGKILKDEGYY
jgi:hypothetical protein